MAFRVPVPDVSVVDLTVTLKKKVSMLEGNKENQSVNNY
jgi:glyceraldehyde-3-phosphate dehydrogenase/erythrose-4-phosphate dehydrogenase